MLRNKNVMLRHLGNLATVQPFDHFHVFGEIRARNGIRNRVVARGNNPLANKDLKPADFGEQFLVLARDLRISTPQLDLCGKRVGNGLATPSHPERLDAFIGAVVQDDEVANALIFEIALTVELVTLGLGRSAARKQLQNTLDR